IDLEVLGREAADRLAVAQHLHRHLDDDHLRRLGIGLGDRRGPCQNGPEDKTNQSALHEMPPPDLFEWTVVTTSRDGSAAGRLVLAALCGRRLQGLGREKDVKDSKDINAIRGCFVLAVLAVLDVLSRWGPYRW